MYNENNENDDETESAVHQKHLPTLFLQGT